MTAGVTRACCLAARDPDAKFVVHALAAPAGDGRFAVDVQPLRCMCVVDLGPVLDVMCIEIVLVGAAGKAATGIPSVQRPGSRSLSASASTWITT